MPSLGWERAYRSGDVVVHDPEGLLFGGPRGRPGQDRRAADRARRDRQRPARAARRGRRRRRRPPDRGGQPAARRLRHRRRPVRLGRGRWRDCAASMPGRRWCRGWRRSTTIPTRTSGQGRPRRAPLAAARGRGAGRGSGLDGTAAWIAELWLEVLGATVTSSQDDFFDLGGGSLTAAQMVSLLRRRFPEVAVGDIYDHPTVGGLADYLDSLARRATTSRERVGPAHADQDPGRPDRRDHAAADGLAAPRWLVWLLAATNVVARAVRRRLAARPSPGGSSSRLAGLRHAARPDAAGRRRRPAAPARADPGELPARRQGAPAAVGGRAAGRPAGRAPAWPGRRG